MWLITSSKHVHIGNYEDNQTTLLLLFLLCTRMFWLEYGIVSTFFILLCLNVQIFVHPSHTFIHHFTIWYSMYVSFTIFMPIWVIIKYRPLRFMMSYLCLFNNHIQWTSSIELIAMAYKPSDLILQTSSQLTTYISHCAKGNISWWKQPFSIPR